MVQAAVVQDVYTKSSYNAHVMLVGIIVFAIGILVVVIATLRTSHNISAPVSFHWNFWTVYGVIVAVVGLVFAVIGYYPANSVDISKIEKGYGVSDISEVSRSNITGHTWYNDSQHSRLIPITFFDKAGAPHEGYLSIIRGNAKIWVGTEGHVLTVYHE